MCDRSRIPKSNVNRRHFSPLYSNCTMTSSPSIERRLIRSTINEPTRIIPLIKEKHVGRPVLVGGQRQGVLRFVGSINDKKGLYCGVELYDDDEGKHDGRFGDTRYFTCPPMRGIFAPLYKVELIVENEGQIDENPTDFLTKSAMSTFTGEDEQLADIYPNLDCSISTNQIGISYTKESFVHELGVSYTKESKIMLQDVQSSTSSESSIDLFNIEPPDEFLFDLSSSIEKTPVLDNVDISMLLDGSDKLPMISNSVSFTISKEYDEKTPIIEMAPSIIDNNNLERQNSLSNRNDDVLAQKCAHFEASPNQDQIENLRESKSIQNETTSESCDSQKSRPRDISTFESLKKNEKISNNDETVNFRQSGRLKDTLPSPAARAAVRLPKKTSKQQQMMDRLKASIEAEKARPKKEIRSKLAEILRNSQPSKDDEHPAIDTMPSRNSPSHSRSLVGRNIPPPPPRQPPKERQSLLPPRMTDKKCKVANENDCSSESAKSAVSSFNKNRHNTLPVRSYELKNTESKAVHFVSQSTIEIHRAKNAFIKHEKDAELRSGKKDTKMMEKELNSLLITTRDLREECLSISSIIVEIGENLSSSIAELSRKTADIEPEREKLTQKHVQDLALLTKNSDLNLKIVIENSEAKLRLIEEQCRKEKELVRNEARQKMETSLTKQKEVHKAQIDEISTLHQSQCTLLDEKLLEAEKQIRHLKREKENLQKTLSADRDQKVKNLSAEVTSLNTALEMKIDDVKNLYLAIGKLELQVDEIPRMKAENRKLTQRIVDLTRNVERGKDTEKVLRTSYEVLQKSTHKTRRQHESILHENDILRYKLDQQASSEDEQAVVQSPMVANLHPNSLPRRHKFGLYNFDDPLQSEADNNNKSAAVVDASCSSENDDLLNRSLISLYQQGGRMARLDGNDDISIYTPQGLYREDDTFDDQCASSSKPSNVRLFLGDEPREDAQVASTSARCKSSPKNVTDSGIFSSIHSQPVIERDSESV